MNRHPRYSSPERIEALARGNAPGAASKKKDLVAAKIVDIARQCEAGRSSGECRRVAYWKVLDVASSHSGDVAVYSSARSSYVRASSYYALAVRCKADGDIMNAKRFLALSCLANIAGNFLASSDPDELTTEKISKFLPGFAKDFELLGGAK